MSETSEIVVGVIEPLSDSGADPEVIVGDSVAAVKAEAARRLWPMAAAGDIEYIDGDWIAGFPEPDYDDAAAVEAWLDELRDASTDMWLTVFAPGGYTDVRMP
jgi:hypothetical protein